MPYVMPGQGTMSPEASGCPGGNRDSILADQGIINRRLYLPMKAYTNNHDPGLLKYNLSDRC